MPSEPVTPSSPAAPDQHRVVVNDEEQYALLPARTPLPAGWREAGCSGSKDDCLAYVEEHWRDMRPLSLRR
ncbi:MbtH family protein [Streptomyces sp. NPDC102405]|uniref:MbtH family protein n=1 Tax=Streptomyces sp. NPDC102405 TaxID=3366170 RepID=UPI0038252274